MLPPHREHTWHQWPLSHPSGQQLRIPAAEAQITSFLSAFLHTPSQTHSRWAGPLKYTWLQPCPSLTPANPTPPPLGCYNSSTPCLSVLPQLPQPILNGDARAMPLKSWVLVHDSTTQIPVTAEFMPSYARGSSQNTVSECMKQDTENNNRWTWIVVIKRRSIDYYNFLPWCA